MPNLLAPGRPMPRVVRVRWDHGHGRASRAERLAKRGAVMAPDRLAGVSELVTGEGVVLDLRLARLPTRALAFGIDAVVLIALAVAVTFVIGATVETADPALAATLMLVSIVAVLVGIPVTVETLSRGRSLGKLILGLRVVRDDGGPVRFRHALTRGLAGFFIDFWVTGGAGAVICSILSKHAKRVGDVLAGTVVIKERTPARILPLPPMPAPLAAWAQSLELSRLPDDLALAARTYLTRSDSLSTKTREAMAVQLANAIAAYVSPGTPPGTPPWTYVAAVLAERRRRSEASLYAYVTATPLPTATPGWTSPADATARTAADSRAEGGTSASGAPTTGGFVPPQ
jgi:uncharacterized RDD family membrane protein YckC